MSATIANWAITPPKLVLGVSRYGIFQTGSSASNANPTTPYTHCTGRASSDHHRRMESPGASARAALMPLPALGSRRECRWDGT
ncbi:Uncharacterised protein [Mycobacteroides abscessus subsp. abscessus]|nr:Uncharacterised protein [Mycobacteroides abscessus subsp. abscessus]SIL90408.1 Uncharacterised protein [Mycobacteroides abscessus subsp. abscessus]SKS20072.1 Uncharacterised protein [Mycobacteroides abscessus subsp. abscessus]